VIYVFSRISNRSLNLQDRLSATQVGLLTVNRLTGPKGRTGPETDGPVNRRIIHYLAITAHVYKFRFMNIALPQIFSFRLHFCTKAAAAAWLGTSD